MMNPATFKKEVRAHMALEKITSCTELKEYHKFFVFGLHCRYHGQKYKKFYLHEPRWRLADSPDRNTMFRGRGYRDGFNFSDLSAGRCGRKGWKNIFIGSIKVHPSVVEQLESLAKKYGVSVAAIRRTAYLDLIKNNGGDDGEMFFKKIEADLLTSLR